MPHAAGGRPSAAFQPHPAADGVQGRYASPLHPAPAFTSRLCACAVAADMRCAPPEPLLAPPHLQAFFALPLLLRTPCEGHGNQPRSRVPILRRNNLSQPTNKGTGAQRASLQHQRRECGCRGGLHIEIRKGTRAWPSRPQAHGWTGPRRRRRDALRTTKRRSNRLTKVPLSPATACRGWPRLPQWPPADKTRASQ